MKRLKIKEIAQVTDCKSAPAGGFIHLPPSSSTLDYNNTTLLHEYGHFLQTRQWGFLTLPSSFSSLANTIPNGPDTHRKFWTEQDANVRTIDYFNGKWTDDQGQTFADKYYNHQYYDNRYIRWWYLLAPDPFFITYYNVNNNPR